MEESVFRELLAREFSALEYRAEPEERSLWSGSQRLLAMSQDSDRWTLDTGSGHAHAENLEELLGLAAEILRGKVAMASEFRSGELAATWLVDSEGETFHESLFFCPFDSAEWDARPGDVWTVEHHRLTPNAGNVVEMIERMSNPATSTEMPLLWLEEAMETAPAGTRWTTVGNCILPVPLPLRRTRFGNDTSDFMDSQRRILVRCSTYVREGSGPEPTTDEAIRSADIAMSSLEEGTWVGDRYDITFLSQPRDRLAVISLYWQKADGAPDYREVVQAAMGIVRMAPSGWAM